MSATPNENLNAILTNFQKSVANDPTGTQVYQTLTEVLNLDPALLDSLNTNAASGGPLVGFQWISGSSIAEDSNGVITIGSNYLSNPTSIYALDELISHENYHVGYQAELDSQTSSWQADVGQYFGNQLPLATPDTLLTQYQQINAANEGGALLTGVNSSLQLYMAQNGLSSLTSDNIKSLLQQSQDPALSVLFNSDGTIVSGHGFVQNSDGTLDFNANLSAAESFMGIQVGSNGEVYNEMWAASALYSMAGASNGAPISLNFSADGILQNGNDPSQPLTDLQADNLFVAQNGLVTSNWITATINDTGSGETSTFTYLAPGAFGNGLSTSSSVSVNVSPTSPVSLSLPSIDYFEDVGPSGQDIYEIETTTTNGDISASITGVGAYDAVSNANISLAADVGATLRGNNNSINMLNGSNASIYGAGNIVDAGSNDNVYLNSNASAIINGVSYQESGSYAGDFAFNSLDQVASITDYNANTGLESQEDFFTDGIDTSRNLFNISGSQTDALTFDPSTGIETSDTQYSVPTGVRTDESLYDGSNGKQTDAVTFDSNGNEVSDVQYSESTGYATNENLYNTSGQETEQILFAPGTTTATNEIYFDPSTGDETYQNNYTSGQLISQDNYNTSGQLTTQEDYNASGQETDQVLFTPGTTNIYQANIYDPSTGQETAQQNFNSAGQETSQDNFNTSDQLVSQYNYDSEGQETSENLVTPGTTNIYQTNIYDPSTGQETAQQNFNSAGQETSQDNFNTSGQLVSEYDYDASGQETEEQVVVPGTTTLQTQYFFSADGNETYQNNFTDGINTSRQFFDDSGNETGEALFGSDGQLTEYGAFDPSTGQLTQDIQYSNGTPTQLTNYANGNPTSTTLYNSAGQETQYSEYNGDTTNNYLFQPGASYSYENQVTDSNGNVIEDDTFDSATGQLQQVARYNGGPYPYEVDTADGGSYFSQIDLYDDQTGQLVGEATYDPTDGFETGASGTLADGDTSDDDDGGYGDDDGGYFTGYDGGGYFGGYGFAGKASTVQASLKQNVGEIAQYDLSHGNTQGAQAAEVALHEAAASAGASAGALPTAGGNAVLEGAQWDSRQLTWSLTAPAGASAATTMAYDSDAEQAFAAWAAASGLKFTEVSNPDQADIQIGFANLGTTQSGIVGYTTYQAQNGQISDADIRLENPGQDALISGANGQLQYSGTAATLTQAMEHEIGHALGFADSTDPSSIMYYALSQTNRMLDGADRSGAQTLYGTTASAGSLDDVQRVGQLIQAMATYAPSVASSMQTMPIEHRAIGVQLATPIH